jgi:DTW domain-containing protein YfiP
MSAEIKAYLDSQGLSEAMTAEVKQVIIERPANALKAVRAQGPDQQCAYCSTAKQTRMCSVHTSS